MEFYYFAFVHYILITIRRPPGTETLNKKKRYGIHQENMATNRHIEDFIKDIIDTNWHSDRNFVFPMCVGLNRQKHRLYVILYHIIHYTC